MNQKRYINLINSRIDIFTAREILIMDDVIVRLSDMSASQIEDYVHGDAPWEKTSDKEIIPYNLVFQRGVPYAKNDYDNLNEWYAAGAKDILNNLGTISKEEYDYYENL